MGDSMTTQNFSTQIKKKIENFNKISQLKKNLSHSTFVFCTKAKGDDDPGKIDVFFRKFKYSKHLIILLFVIVACSSGKVPMLDLRTGAIESIMDDKFPDVNCVSWSRFHENIIALTCSLSDSLQIWDIRHLKRHYISLYYSSNVAPYIQFLNHSVLVSLRDHAVDFISLFDERITVSIPISIGDFSRSMKRKQFAFDSLDYPQYIYIPGGESLEIFDLSKKSKIKSYTSSLYAPEIVLMNESLQEVYSFASSEVSVWKQIFQ